MIDRIFEKGCSMSKINNEVSLQLEYYAQTAEIYDELHVNQNDEHYFALSLLSSMIEHFDCISVLDVGSGTGRCLDYLKKKFPQIKIIGIEPSAALRQIGYDAGISSNELIDGDALKIAFESNSFDIVCEFGVLHHIKKPRTAISEMLRVSKKGIFISDDNHFAKGSCANRFTKKFLKKLGLWKLAYWLRTFGKAYRISEGDGISYPYSVFDDLHFIKKHCSKVHLTNTKDCSGNLYASAENVALFGLKV